MTAVFEDAGIRFSYPENWVLEREDNAEGWTVSLQSPGTAFAMICVREDLPSVDEMTVTALETLREDYPDLEADECIEVLAGQPAIGHDIRFFSFDLTNTCWTRCVYTSCGTILILCQTSDLELEQVEPIFRAICASLRVDDDAE